MFNILNWTSTLEDSCFYSSVLSEAVTIAIINRASFRFMLRYEKKLNLLNKQCFYRNSVRCQKLQVFKVQSFNLDTGPQSFCYLCIALLIIRCSKSAQKFAVRMRQVATVVMATTQLVPSQLKNFLLLRIEWGLSLPKIISKRCELVKLCHINRSGPVFLKHWWTSSCSVRCSYIFCSCCFSAAFNLFVIRKL